MCPNIELYGPELATWQAVPMNKEAALRSVVVCAGRNMFFIVSFATTIKRIGAIFTVEIVFVVEHKAKTTVILLLFLAVVSCFHHKRTNYTAYVSITATSHQSSPISNLVPTDPDLRTPSLESSQAAQCCNHSL